jgi:hypothetical protein
MPTALPANLMETPIAYVYYIDNTDYIPETNSIADTRCYQNRSLLSVELSIDLQIIKEIENLGFTIENMKENSFEDNSNEFRVFSAELKEEIPDYSKLLQKEKYISKKLGLYNKNIILEMV